MREEDERIEEAKRCFVARPDMTLEMFEHRLDKIMGIAPVPELTKMTEDEIFERRAKQVADDITATFAVPPGYSVLDDLARSYKAKPLRDAKGRFIKKFQFDVHLLDEPYPIEIMTPAYAPLPATMIKE